MRLNIATLISIFLLVGCVNNTQIQNVAVAEIEDSDEITVCGEVDGEKRTYPTLGDLKNDGAEFKYYGQCEYE